MSVQDLIAAAHCLLAAAEAHPGFDPAPAKALRAALAAAPEQAEPVGEVKQKRGSADGSIFVLWRKQVKPGDLIYTVPPAPAPIAQPHVTKVDRSFRWDGEAQQHVPTLLLEFEPVPANSPCDAKGWTDRDALAKALSAGIGAQEARP